MSAPVHLVVFGASLVGLTLTQGGWYEPEGLGVSPEAVNITMDITFHILAYYAWEALRCFLYMGMVVIIGDREVIDLSLLSHLHTSVKSP